MPSGYVNGMENWPFIFFSSDKVPLIKNLPSLEHSCSSIESKVNEGGISACSGFE